MSTNKLINKIWNLIKIFLVITIVVNFAKMSYSQGTCSATSSNFCVEIAGSPICCELVSNNCEPGYVPYFLTPDCSCICLPNFIITTPPVQITDVKYYFYEDGTRYLIEKLPRNNEIEINISVSGYSVEDFLSYGYSLNITIGGITSNYDSTNSVYFCSYSGSICNILLNYTVPNLQLGVYQIDFNLCVGTLCTSYSESVEVALESIYLYRLGTPLCKYKNPSEYLYLDKQSHCKDFFNARAAIIDNNPDTEEEFNRTIIIDVIGNYEKEISGVYVLFNTSKKVDVDINFGVNLSSFSHACDLVINGGTSIYCISPVDDWRYVEIVANDTFKIGEFRLIYESGDVSINTQYFDLDLYSYLVNEVIKPTLEDIVEYYISLLQDEKNNTPLTEVKNNIDYIISKISELKTAYYTNYIDSYSDFCSNYLSKLEEMNNVLAELADFVYDWTLAYKEIKACPNVKIIETTLSTITDKLGELGVKGISFDFIKVPYCDYRNGYILACLGNEMDSCACVKCNGEENPYGSFFLDVESYGFNDPMGLRKSYEEHVLSTLDYATSFVEACKLMYGNSDSCLNSTIHFINQIWPIIMKKVSREVSYLYTSFTPIVWNFIPYEMNIYWALCNYTIIDPTFKEKISINLPTQLIFAIKDELNITSFLCR